MWYMGAMEGLRGTYMYMPQDQLERRFGEFLVDPSIIPDRLYAGPPGGDGGTMLEFFDRQLDPADFDDEGDHFGYIWVSSEARVDDESGGVFDRPGFRYAHVFSLDSAQRKTSDCRLRTERNSCSRTTKTTLSRTASL